MKKILAVGGSVIKTARDELIEVIRSGQVEMLIHNGGSIFHDFQKESDFYDRDDHSYPLDQLLNSYRCNDHASDVLWTWLSTCNVAPPTTATRYCEEMNIPVLMFTGLACDFWQLFNDSWEVIARKAKEDFSILCTRFQEGEFHYVCMGSAVIHPEVFIKAIAVAKPPKFTADVVDFLDMYRPRTRVAKFGTYYQMTHQEYLKGLL
jgi:hypothetical protein